MSDIESHYRAEQDYITDYPEVIDNTKADNILKAWNINILGRGEEENLEISEVSNPIKTFILPVSHTDELRKLRYGVVNSEIIRKVDSLVVENMEETIRQRVEYGGHINVDTKEITLKYKGINGAIKEYEFLKDKINYHTHPSLINKWGFSPPSETDLKTTVTESHRLNKRIVSLVAAAEGIYVYYLTKELFDFFNTVEGHSKIGSIDDYFKDLKLLLGYVRSGPARPQQNIRPREEQRDSNPRRVKRVRNSRIERSSSIDADADTDVDASADAEVDIPSIRRNLFADVDADTDADVDVDVLATGMAMLGGAALSPPRERRREGVTLINRKIRIGTFLDIIRNMGFFIKLYEYEKDLEIQIPNDIVTTDVMPAVTSVGGSKIYKINFTKL